MFDLLRCRAPLTSMSTPWAELRLRVGSADNYNSNNEHDGVATHVIPISAAIGQLTEAWTEIQSLTPETSASLHESDGNLLAYQSPDKAINNAARCSTTLFAPPAAEIELWGGGLEQHSAVR